LLRYGRPRSNAMQHQHIWTNEIRADNWSFYFNECASYQLQTQLTNRLWLEEGAFENVSSSIFSCTNYEHTVICQRIFKNKTPLFCSCIFNSYMETEIHITRDKTKVKT